ncbi:MAG TPA: dockerin type I repeat-containing protein [Candidatus Limnocylindrales bacterium]|nr:dockerin type I repeat-containing protein [Candidatus Limnocylindrales bacterium]
MVSRRCVYVIVIGALMLCSHFDAAEARQPDGVSETTVLSPNSPRIPVTSFPLPSTSFPNTTVPPTLPPTTTTMPASECGDANNDSSVTASDALAVLRAAVGTFNDCPMSRCDADGNGSLTASDALRVLRRAVGTSVTMSCPA